MTTNTDFKESHSSFCIQDSRQIQATFSSVGREIKEINCHTKGMLDWTGSNAKQITMHIQLWNTVITYSVMAECILKFSWLKSTVLSLPFYLNSFFFSFRYFYNGQEIIFP